MEVGFNSPSRKRAHFTSTKGNKARKAQGRGERNHINIIDEVDYHVGAFPHPFRGHEVACRLLQPLWGRQRPTARSYSHTPSPFSSPPSATPPQLPIAPRHAHKPTPCNGPPDPSHHAAEPPQPP
eukprot:scaffold13734_cov116-Isochrysis_galbana.AAC.1